MSRTRSAGLWPWVSLVLCLLLASQTYLTYKYPIKQDVFGHPFRTHLVDRVKAYANLLRSDHRTTHMPVADIQAIIRDAAREFDVDPALVEAIVLYESYYLPSAISTTGAMGLMALQPQTARAQGVTDPFDPRDNIRGGTRLLRQHARTFGGDLTLMVAAYNAGAGSVRRFGGVPPYTETRAYVANVLRLRDALRQAPASGGTR